MRSFTIFFLFMLSFSFLYSQNDTIVINAVTFEDRSPEGWNANYHKIVKFPEGDTEWHKIIMVQTLKCDQRTKADTFPCGEWDYIWHTIIDVPKGDTVEQFCIGSFVTPYGKRLKLGEENRWTWVYDVTDYAPILKGERNITTGNNQELLDMKFLFIKGKPVRKAIQVENLYPFGTYKYEYLADDSLLKSKNIKLNKNAEMYSLKARISGHGHAGPRNCCEWDSKTHTYYINEGEKFRWNVWKDCGFNPIYPQGGTWPFDRAGWCPGTKVDEYNFELTPIVKKGDSLEIDYGIEYYCDNGEKDGKFQMTHQLISYSEANFKNDAEIVDIIAPSTKGEHQRINPICSNPVIEIKNTGVHNLKRLKLRYGIKNGEELNYTWHGNLEFLESEIVSLPAPNWEAANNSSIFYAEIVNVNNNKDECNLNNRLESKYIKPLQLPGNFIVYVKTNNLGRAAENTLSISKSDGNNVFYFDDFMDVKEYFHEISVESGCYELKYIDDKEDGMLMHWWYWNSDKSKVGKNGKIKILSFDKKEVLYEFNFDFGEKLILNFTIL